MSGRATGADRDQVRWRFSAVESPRLDEPVPVVVAEDVPCSPGANRFQNLRVYLPRTSGNERLVDRPVTELPIARPGSPGPWCLVHVHGGAWRDPQLTSRSVEAAVAHAFADPVDALPIRAIASLNYTLSPFPTHPTLPYDPDTDGHTDASREAVHPAHLADVLQGLALLASWGLEDDSYVLSGHSAGACLGFEATLASPAHHGLENVPNPPRPAAQLGLNGLYDLPALVDGLGPTHEHLRDSDEDLLGHAFGPRGPRWVLGSPARLDPPGVAERVAAGFAPGLVLLDESPEDELVPMNQKDRLAALLSTVPGLRVLEGHRCTGTHAAPWEQGSMLWQSVQDALAALEEP